MYYTFTFKILFQSEFFNRFMHIWLDVCALIFHAQGNKKDSDSWFNFFTRIPKRGGSCDYLFKVGFDILSDSSLHISEMFGIRNIE